MTVFLPETKKAFIIYLNEWISLKEQISLLKYDIHIHQYDSALYPFCGKFCPES